MFTVGLGFYVAASITKISSRPTVKIAVTKKDLCKEAFSYSSCCKNVWRAHEYFRETLIRR